MEDPLKLLLQETVQDGFEMPDRWHGHDLTQGNGHPQLVITSIREKKVTTDLVSMMETDEQHVQEKPDTKHSRQSRQTNQTRQIVDILASKIDEMFRMYPFEMKRDIRICLRERLINWVSKHARGFFGPSTSRSISACLRGQGIVMADVEKFAEFVSFMLDGPVKAGIKTVIWHGYTDTATNSSTVREPICELVMKPQGVFVSNYKN